MLGSSWRDNPAVTVADVGNRKLVAAMNAAAEMAGLAPGMSLTDARTVIPDLHVAPADPKADAAALRRLARWCERYTPFVAVADAESLFLDVTGCSHLFGGERPLLADLRGRLSETGLSVRAALADTPGAAWAASHYAQDPETVIAPGRQGEVAASLPVAALRLDPATAGGLSRVGLKTIGDLYPLPRASLAARFGESAIQRLDQVLGRSPEPISPVRPEPPHRARLRFPDGIGRPEDIAAALEGLLATVCEGLKRSLEGGRRVELIAFRVDHTTQTLSIATARPLRDPAGISRLFAEKLGTLDPGFGIETLMLSARSVEPLEASQPGLANGGPGESMEMAEEERADLIARLSNRLGPARVIRFAPLESHMPERAFRRVAALEGEAARPWRQHEGAPVRPLRLLARPEALDAITLIPDGEPGDPPAGFRWRRRHHRVRRALGPERILPEWWQDDGAWNDEPRDYWRVQDEEGAQFWIFRKGAPVPDVAPRWFLHGLFN